MIAAIEQRDLDAYLITVDAKVRAEIQSWPKDWQEWWMNLEYEDLLVYQRLVFTRVLVERPDLISYESKLNGYGEPHWSPQVFLKEEDGWHYHIGIIEVDPATSAIRDGKCIVPRAAGEQEAGLEIASTSSVLLHEMSPKKVTDELVENLSGLGEGKATSVVVDKAGNMHAVYVVQKDNGATHLRYRHRTPSGEWEPAVELGHPASGLVKPSIVLDANGDVHLVYSTKEYGQGHLVYQCRTKDGWGEPEEIPGASAWTHTSLAVDSQGIVHVVWAQGTPKYTQRTPDGTWRPEPETLEKGIFANGPVALVLDDEDRAYVSYVIDTYSALKFTTKPKDGVWSPPKTVAEPGYTEGLEMALGPDKTPYVAYMHWRDGLYFLKSVADGLWTRKRLTAKSPYSLKKSVSLKVDAEGATHLAYGNENTHLTYSILPKDATTWSTVDQTLQKVMSQDLSVGPDGHVHLNYMEIDGGTVQHREYE